MLRLHDDHNCVAYPSIQWLDRYQARYTEFKIVLYLTDTPNVKKVPEQHPPFSHWLQNASPNQSGLPFCKSPLRESEISEVRVAPERGFRVGEADNSAERETTARSSCLMRRSLRLYMACIWSSSSRLRSRHLLTQAALIFLRFASHFWSSESHEFGREYSELVCLSPAVADFAKMIGSVVTRDGSARWEFLFVDEECFVGMLKACFGCRLSSTCSAQLETGTVYQYY